MKQRKRWSLSFEYKKQRGGSNIFSAQKTENKMKGPHGNRNKRIHIHVYSRDDVQFEKVKKNFASLEEIEFHAGRRLQIKVNQTFIVCVKVN